MEKKKNKKKVRKLLERLRKYADLKQQADERYKSLFEEIEAAIVEQLGIAAPAAGQDPIMVRCGPDVIMLLGSDQRPQLLFCDISMVE